MLSRWVLSCVLVISGSFSLAACGSSDPAPASVADTGAPPGDTGAPRDGEPDAEPIADAAVDTGADDTSVEPDAAPCSDAVCATLSGKVLRKPLTKPQNGGKGNVYVAVFDKDPVVDRDNAKLVGQALIENVDMTDGAASVAYSVPGITPRPQPYFVVAFLDDNKNASPTTPGPDKGDLVSLEGIGAPKVTLSKPGTVSFDLSLNAVLPF
jgi:hypothetical protein